MSLNKLFYQIKPIIPRPVQITIRRQIAIRKRKLCENIWPIDESAAKPPLGWKGWPYKKTFALVLTHDVDTESGQDRVLDLANTEKEMGFRSSFNFVPERYNVSSELREFLTNNSFEVAVHGLYHDGKLFLSKKIFNKRVKKINYYLKEWKSVGFHSPSTLRNLNWISALNIDYDQSTFDTDPFEPQSDGVGTIFPFLVKGNPSKRTYVELPYTLPQDHTLFIIMKERSIKIWQQKLDWVVNNCGMVLLNTHPDYMNFDGKKSLGEGYPSQHYRELLEYIKRKYEGQYWHVLPKDMARFWQRQMGNKERMRKKKT